MTIAGQFSNALRSPRKADPPRFRESARRPQSYEPHPQRLTSEGSRHHQPCLNPAARLALAHPPPDPPASPLAPSQHLSPRSFHPPGVRGSVSPIIDPLWRHRVAQAYYISANVGQNETRWSYTKRMLPNDQVCCFCSIPTLAAGVSSGAVDCNSWPSQVSAVTTQFSR